VEKFKSLNLTEEEKKVIVMDDREDDKEEGVFAIAGKVLSVNEFHIQTISSALRPAWGNPRGLKFQSHGDNIFVATLESKRDVDRIWDGAPWMIGFHAVILENFETSMRPHEVGFDRLPIWIRCHDLPFNWLNSIRAEFVASQVGKFIKLDLSGTSRGWGQSMRAKIWLNVNKPLRRVISFNSLKRGKIDTYEVQYERLPYFCFGCGLLGHSDTHCRNPLPRRADGSWEYDSSIRFPEIRKKKPQPVPVMKQEPPVNSKSGVQPTWEKKLGREQVVSGRGGPVIKTNVGQVKDAVFKFDAQATGHYVEKPNAHKYLDLSHLPGDSAAMKLLQATTDENQGIKRTAVLNSPSKVGAVQRDPKKTKTGDELATEDAEMAAAEPQPRPDP
jgi:hypothetical protein